jgi:ATP-binding protein involved in chromosome partitioning
MGYTVGVLDADIWGFSVPRMLGVTDRLVAEKTDEGRARITPNERKGGRRPAEGGVDRDDRRGRGHGAHVAWPHAHRAVQQFLRDVPGVRLDYLLIDMPPGTGDVQMGLARMLPRARDLVIVTTPGHRRPEGGHPGRDMARKSFLRVAGVIENMSAFVCDHGESYPLFGSGGGEALADEVGAELLGQVPIEAGVALGGDTGEPVSIAGVGPAADAFRAIATKLVTETVPPVAMAGCSARVLESVERLLGAKDAADAGAAAPAAEPVQAASEA